MSEDKAEDGTVKKRTGQKTRQPRKITEKYLYNAGLAYLERFPASIPHFRSVMGRKIMRSCRFHTDQDEAACYRMLDDLVDQFIQAGYLDDEAYTRGMVTSLRGRGLSATGIIYKLRQKGLAEEPVRAAIARYDDEYNITDGELIAGLKLARRKRIGPFARQDNPDLHQKWLGALARAGFSYDMAQKILGLSRHEAEETYDVRAL